MASRPKLKGKRGSDPPAVESDEAVEVRARVGGINPHTLKPDSQDRFDEFELLRKFYVTYTDGERVREGLGEIVDWVLNNGEEAFEERVKDTYKGFNLSQFREKQQMTKMKSLPSEEVRPVESKRNMRSLMSIPKPFRTLSYTRRSVPLNELPPQPEPEPIVDTPPKPVVSAKSLIKAQLEDFYAVHDPKMVGSPRFDRIYNYALERGTDQVNVKLQKLYGARCEFDLTDAEDDTAEPTPQKIIVNQRRKSLSTMFAKADRKSKKDLASGTRSVVSMPHQSVSYMGGGGMKSIAASNAKNDLKTLPPQMKLFLKLFYAVYDPLYILQDKLEQVHTFASHVGLDSLNASLKTKYKETLSDFQARVEIMQDEMHSFFLKKDIANANENLLGIVQWAMRNGRRYANQTLRVRYGCDLDTYRDPKAARMTSFDNAAEEPVF